MPSTGPFSKRVALALIAALAFGAHLDGASRIPVRARNGMVVAVDAIAAQVGVDIMKKGGNAVDAAVAVGLALAVTWPVAGNLGGGGFMMIRFPDGRTEVIDYRERAPLAATRDMYLDADGNVIDKASTLGYRAIAVPGTVSGLALAQGRHGKLAWKDVVEPARRLAADGFVVSYHLARNLNEPMHASRLDQFPESRRIFRKPWREGDTFRQPDLAATLSRIRDRGADDFYRGVTARMIVDDIRANGGIVTAADLEQYEPTIRQPLRGTYRGYEVLSMPPPSSGGAVLIEMLNMLEHFDVASSGHNSADGVHLLIEVMRRAYADRAAFMADTDFAKAPIAGLISRKYAAERARTINRDKVTPSTEIRAGDPLPFEPPSTTHFNVVDSSGMVVANTYTLNEGFGGAATARGTGILLNNEMDDFTTKPGVPNLYGLVQSPANAIAPRKRPLSAMAPTIVLKDGKFFMAVGTPGGGSIINTILQVILNVIDHGMNIQEAVEAPRIHHQWLPDEIYWEKGGLSPDTRSILEKRGYAFRKNPDYSAGDVGLGDAEVVAIEPDTGLILGAADPRRGGTAIGY
jgi:gamma-glutamyltranspeptidase/glutathione hydrolase